MSNYGKANDSQRISFYDAQEWNLDKTVQPHTMVRGAMGKDHDAAIHAWRYLRVSSSGAISNDDAANFRVSAVGLTGLDISNDDAADFRISAIIDSGSISAMQGDAAFLRISAIGSETRDGTLIDGLDQTLSAMIVSSRSIDFSGLNLSATPQLAVRPGTEDASEHRVSAFQDDASNLMVSAKSKDAGLFRISAIDLTFSGDASGQRISAIEMNYKQILAYHATYTDDVEYLGRAIPGTATSAVSTWQIQKFTYLAAGKVSGMMWAEGSDSFDREFDERENYSYS